MLFRSEAAGVEAKGELEEPPKTEVDAWLTGCEDAPKTDDEVED